MSIETFPVSGGGGTVNPYEFPKVEKVYTLSNTYGYFRRSNQAVNNKNIIVGVIDDATLSKYDTTTGTMTIFSPIDTSVWIRLYYGLTNAVYHTDYVVSNTQDDYVRKIDYNGTVLHTWNYTGLHYNDVLEVDANNNLYFLKATDGMQLYKLASNATLTWSQNLNTTSHPDSFNTAYDYQKLIAIHNGYVYAVSADNQNNFTVAKFNESDGTLVWITNRIYVGGYEDTFIFKDTIGVVVARKDGRMTIVDLNGNITEHTNPHGYGDVTALFLDHDTDTFYLNISGSQGYEDLPRIEKIKSDGTREFLKFGNKNHYYWSSMVGSDTFYRFYHNSLFKMVLE